MESETKQAELKASENQEDILNKKVGNLEAEKLKAANVVVKDISIQDQMKKGSDKPVGKMVHMFSKHPDKEEAIDITKVIYRKSNKEAVKESGLWYNEDKEGNIQKGSALAILMSYYKAETLGQLESKELSTEPNEAGFLCFKAY